MLLINIEVFLEREVSFFFILISDDGKKQAYSTNATLLEYVAFIRQVVFSKTDIMDFKNKKIIS